MPECPICRREFEDEFSVFVPPHPEGFDSIDCAQKAVLIWGAAAGGAVAPIVLPTIEFVPPPPIAGPVPAPVAPVVRRGLAALAALALVPSQVALAGGVGLAAAGTAASVYLAAKPVLQAPAPAPVAVATTPAVEPAKPSSARGSGTSSGSATTSSSGAGSATAPAPRARQLTHPLKPAARRSVVVSTRPAHRIKIAAKARVARSHVKPENPSQYATTSTAEFASQPVRTTPPEPKTPPPEPKRSSHPKPKRSSHPKKPKPDRTPSKPHPPQTPPTPKPPQETPAPAPPQPSSSTVDQPASSAREVAGNDQSPPPNKPKKDKEQPQPAPTPQPDPTPQSQPDTTCDDNTRPGNGYGDKNHDHSGPPGQDGGESNTNGSDNGKGQDDGKGKGH